MLAAAQQSVPVSREEPAALERSLLERLPIAPAEAAQPGLFHRALSAIGRGVRRLPHKLAAPFRGFRKNRPTAAPEPVGPQWKPAVSPSVGILRQLEADEALSPQNRFAQLDQERQLQAGRYRSWEAAHAPKLGESPYLGKKGVETYSDNLYYKLINEEARSGKTPAAARPQDVAVAREASDAIQKSLTTGEHTRLQKDTVVHRGVRGDFRGIFGSQLGNAAQAPDLNAALSGKILSDKAFTSTTLNPAIAHRFAGMEDGRVADVEHTLMHAVLPQGIHGQYIAPVSKYQEEEELLLPKDAPFRIIDAQDRTKISNGKLVPYRDIRGAFLRGLAGGHRTRKPPHS